MEHVAARLFSNVGDERPLILAFEDWEYGKTDLDYNDVIFQIEIRPTSLGITQYDKVIPNLAGIHSDRQSRGVEHHLQRLGMNQSGFEKIGQLFILPNQNITLTMLEDRSSMKFDLCVFDYQAVAHLNPSSLEFRKTAAQKAVSLMDDRVADIGSKITFSPASLGLAGKTVGFLIVPNNTRSTFLTNPWRYTPKGEGDRTKRQPLFTLHGANPGLQDQFLTFNTATSTVFAIEDHTRHHDAYLPELGEQSDNSFDDIIVQFDHLLQPAGSFQTNYRVASPDPTTGYVRDDGHAPSDSTNRCCY